MDVFNIDTSRRLWTEFRKIFRRREASLPAPRTPDLKPPRPSPSYTEKHMQSEPQNGLAACRLAAAHRAHCRGRRDDANEPSSIAGASVALGFVGHQWKPVGCLVAPQSLILMRSMLTFHSPSSISVGTHSSFCFLEQALTGWMKQRKCKKFGMVAILGCQSSGKSTLLNKLFGTKFPVMDASKGRYTCTDGIWVSKVSQFEP